MSYEDLAAGCCQTSVRKIDLGQGAIDAGCPWRELHTLLLSQR